jgi:D-alanyl-D-alanine carboxypeptidase
MTTYVVFRAIEAGEIDFDSPIEMTARAAQEPPSKMGYPPARSCASTPRSGS